MRQEYSIVARCGKKGKTFYVRYFLDNKMVPSQWSTGTDNYSEAEVFAKENRDSILKNYFNRKEGKILYSILQKYYEKDSSYLAIDAVRGRKLNDNSRKILHGFMLHTFIPFLQKNKIKKFDEIKPVLINRFQNFLLLEKHLLPQSINRQISGIKSVFSHLYMHGIIEQNIMKDIAPLRIKSSTIRGCYSADELKGIFKNKWEDRRSYLLCSLIYSAGLRNNEIKSLKVKDILKEDSISFLNIEKSKTVNGIRIVPLHPKLAETLNEWIQEYKLSEDDYLFIRKGIRKFCRVTKKAGNALASLVKKDSETLQGMGNIIENISFYSGRHFYKTMLNSGKLGDIEELFMGHKVGSDVSERYNHKNKRGKEELMKDAQKALEIIDRFFYQ
ncbi:hypothetical protein FACS1894151_07120 [Spirochaetia bacterium]|nr:hypothetical protein FACS1894151_07120 [Spirochaetia bacterium]